MGTVGLPLSPHSTFVIIFFLPILFLCCNNSLLSVQLAHPHSSDGLTFFHQFLPAQMSVFFLEQKDAVQRGQDAFFMMQASGCHCLRTVLCLGHTSEPFLSGDQEFTLSSGFALFSFLRFSSQRLRIPAQPINLSVRQKCLGMVNINHTALPS